MNWGWEKEKEKELERGDQPSYQLKSLFLSEEEGYPQERLQPEEL
eukprot:CAMPEP_0201481148 /NCGR_PEP_ID=MMETSP0151_2-20130828/5467_1 /ASSEMBLY_ACC=CAM_ASM_000257 /TAXON_ID=200890 /ORGANISM="Paramoeba atlantica, Strain 621/1 / CCAP 1560/9" /LENGTH=44 /DNA_ID= /DNA_START= /DNA_END= /DNA_ORIENTATION=